jgi:hypothetical protein
MAANTSPIFVGTPILPQVRIAAANVGLDGSGTPGTDIYTLFTSGANGSFFKGFRYKAEVTTTAGMIRLFVQKGGAGNIELLQEMTVAAVVASATVPAADGEYLPANGIALEAGDVVWVTTENAETFSCWLIGGGDY